MAQPGIAADRFAREIVRFLKVVDSALAAAECQPVGWQAGCSQHDTLLDQTMWRMPKPLSEAQRWMPQSRLNASGACPPRALEASGACPVRGLEASGACLSRDVEAGGTGPNR